MNLGKNILRGPVGIAIDSAQNIYVSDVGYTNTANARVADPAIVVFDRNFNFVRRFGSAGSTAGKFAGLGQIAIANNFIYVAEWDNQRVQKLKLDGTPVMIFGGKSGPNQIDAASGVAVDASGNVFVSQYRAHKVAMFNAAGNIIKQFSAPGGFAAPGEYASPVWRPNQLKFDSAGNLVVANAVFDKNTQQLLRRLNWGTNDFVIDASGNHYSINTGGIDLADPAGNPIKHYQLVDAPNAAQNGHDFQGAALVNEDTLAIANAMGLVILVRIQDLRP